MRYETLQQRYRRFIGGFGRHLAFPNYEKRQKKVVKARSASSTERVRKYREKQRLAAIANGQAEVPEESREPMKHETHRKQRFIERFRAPKN
jgi:hypothetical protein